MKRLLAVSSAVLCGISIGFFAGAGAAQADPGPWSVVPFQATAATAPYVGSGGCDGAGRCVFPGYYVGSSSHTSFVTTVTDGVQAVSPLRPADSAHPDQYATHAACATDGTCVVIGSYRTSNIRSAAFVANASDSGWQAIPAPRPTGSSTARVELDAVACGASACFAVGTFGGNALRGTPVVERYADGHWTPIPLGRPAGVVGYPSMSTIACAGDDRCVAVGVIRGEQSDTRTIGVVWNGTTWTTSVIMLPADASYQYPRYPVSACAPDGSCHVVTAYDTTAGPERLADLANVGGSWRASALPRAAGATYLAPKDLECTAANSCVAVATMSTVHNVFRGLVGIRSGAGWQLSYAAAPDQPGHNDGVSLAALSCAHGDCTGFGSYRSSANSSVPLATTLDSTPTSTVLPTPGRDPRFPAGIEQAVFDGTRQILVGSYSGTSGTDFVRLWIRTV